MLAGGTLPRTHSGIRSADEVRDVAASFSRVARPFEGLAREHGKGGRVAYLSVGPGRIRLGTRQFDSFTPLFNQTREEFLSDNGPMMSAVLEEEDDRPRRGKITGWSQKSRNNMRDTLGSLDYTPMFRPGRQLPKMVTLSLPGFGWELVAPDAITFKRKLIDRALKNTFRRHWGYDFVGVWKLEFQKRGAPHLHILTAPPSGTCKVKGVEYTFESWLRMIWAKACMPPGVKVGDQAYLDHLAKGVHIADTYGLTGTDSKRIADYFVKHGAFSAKEYQNQAPALWAGEDGTASPGRFWGYWGLKKADGDAVLGFVDDGPRASGGGGRADAGSGDFGLTLDSSGEPTRGFRSPSSENYVSLHLPLFSTTQALDRKYA